MQTYGIVTIGGGRRESDSRVATVSWSIAGKCKQSAMGGTDGRTVGLTARMGHTVMNVGETPCLQCPDIRQVEIVPSLLCRLSVMHGPIDPIAREHINSFEKSRRQPSEQSSVPKRTVSDWILGPYFLHRDATHRALSCHDMLTTTARHLIHLVARQFSLLLGTLFVSNSFRLVRNFRILESRICLSSSPDSWEAHLITWRRYHLDWRRFSQCL